MVTATKLVWTLVGHIHCIKYENMNAFLKRSLLNELVSAE